MTRSLLETDAYKLGMAEAGYPLREETFVFVHRHGGPFVVPFDLARAARDLLPRLPTADETAFLDAHGYGLGPAARAALASGAGAIRVDAVPPGTWLLPGEPIATFTGPSALVSWLEPLVLQWTFAIQIATLALRDPEALARAVVRVPSEADAAIVAGAVHAVSGRVPAMRVDASGYAARVTAVARALVDVTGDPQRVFEVGLRAATSREAHLTALAAMAEAGVRRTSHVFGAHALGLVPVGTMGHEHVQRFGTDDAAFRAMRDRRPGRASYLVDTFDTERLGLPAALRLVAEAPARGDAVRFDSGDKIALLALAVTRSRALRIAPHLVFEDGLGVAETRALEAARERLRWPADRLSYGFGSALVAAPREGGLGREAVGAVYKLCETGGVATMKLGDRAKRSLPGRPVVFRRVSGEGPVAMVGQAAEPTPPGMVLLSGDACSGGDFAAAGGVVRHAALDAHPVPSPATAALVARLETERARRLADEEASS